jgi:cytidylate kinase
MEFRSNKLVNTIMVVIVVAAALVWTLVIKPSRLRSQQYQGEIIEVYQAETRHSRRQRFSNPMRTARYNYYWKVITDDGSVIDVEVNRNEWQHAEVGMPVVKVKGETYPFIDLPEQHERRDKNRQARDMLFDSITK